MPEEGSEAVPADIIAERFRDMRAPLLAWLRRRVPDPAEAEDLLQEAFLRVTQRAGSENIAQFEAYVYRTAQSVLADRHRRRRVRAADSHVPLHADDHVEPGAGPERTLLAQERLRQVAAVLMELPDRERAVFVLRRIEGLRYREIALRLNVSVSAVEKDMARAVEHLLLTLGTPDGLG